MTLDELKQLHKMIWLFRREMEKYLPIPPLDERLACAYVEAGEALKAQLWRNPLYGRTVEPGHDVLEELTQCAMMLLLSLPEDFFAGSLSPLIPNDFETSGWTLEEICWMVGLSMLHSENRDVLDVVAGINGSFVNLFESIPAELERMRLKYGPVRDDGKASQNEVANKHNIYPSEAWASGQMWSTSPTSLQEDLQRLGELYKPELVAGQQKDGPPLNLNEWNWWNEEPIRYPRPSEGLRLEDYESGVE